MVRRWGGEIPRCSFANEVDEVDGHLKGDGKTELSIAYPVRQSETGGDSGWFVVYIPEVEALLLGGTWK